MSGIEGPGNLPPVLPDEPPEPAEGPGGFLGLVHSPETGTVGSPSDTAGATDSYEAAEAAGAGREAAEAEHGPLPGAGEPAPPEGAPLGPSAPPATLAAPSLQGSTPDTHPATALPPEHAPPTGPAAADAGHEIVPHDIAPQELASALPRDPPPLAAPPFSGGPAVASGWAPDSAAPRAPDAQAAAAAAAGAPAEAALAFSDVPIPPPDADAIAHSWATLMAHPANAPLAPEARLAAARTAAFPAIDPQLARLASDPAANPQAGAALLSASGRSPTNVALALADAATRGPREMSFAAHALLALSPEIQAGALPQLVRSASLPFLKRLLGSSDAPDALVERAVALYGEAGGDPRRLLDVRAPVRDPRLFAAVLAAMPPERAAAFFAAILSSTPTRAEIAALAGALARLSPESAAILLAALPEDVRAQLAAALPAAAGAGGAGGAGAAASAGGWAGVTGDAAIEALLERFPMLSVEDARALAAAGGGAVFGAGQPDQAKLRALVEQGLLRARAARLEGDGAGAIPGELGEAAARAAPAGHVMGAGVAGGLALAFAALAALLKAGSKDALPLVDEALGPLGAHPFAAIEAREGGESEDANAMEESLELMAAMRSLDFAGLKAVALDRAARQAAELRLSAVFDERSRVRLERVEEIMALLFASDPVGIATFGREHAEVFPPAAARNVMGELFRAEIDGARRPLLAALAQLLRPTSAGSGAPRAFAAGYVAGAAASAAASIASAPLGEAAGDEAPARFAAALFESAAALADAAGPSPGGPAEREGAQRLLDERRGEIESALARALGASAGAREPPARLLRTLDATLGIRFRTMDPEGKVGLLGEFEAGIATFKRGRA